MTKVLEYTNKEALNDPPQVWWKKLVLLHEGSF